MDNKRLYVELPEDLHKRLKQKCYPSIKDVVVKLIRKYVNGEIEIDLGKDETSST